MNLPNSVQRLCAILSALVILTLSTASPSFAQPAPARPAVAQGAGVAASSESFVGSWSASSPDQNWRYALTVNANGTLSDDSGFPGRWRQTGNRIRIDFDVGTFYDGVIGNGSVTGTYGGGGGQGTFIMVRQNAVESFVGRWIATSPDQNWRYELTVNANGTLRDDSGFTGRWTQSGNQITINFDVGTHYSGRIANGAVNGTYSGGGQGRFNMVRR